MKIDEISGSHGGKYEDDCLLGCFPTGPAKVLPCHTGSHISNQFLARGLLIALMMEAASTSETPVNFYQTAWRNIQEQSVKI
jgi:hypothetical protein